MDFGKLASIEHVDFSLPSEPQQNESVLSGVPHAQARLYLGATGYNMKPWVGKWYPSATKDKDFLRCYGTQFNTIEHNTTHYRIPDAATVERWREETPDDFRFCPKIPQTISHARDLGLSGSQIEWFCREIAGLGPKLGPCFMQLPPHVSPAQHMLLLRFLERFPKNIPLAMEVRHPDFFNDSLDAETYFQLLEEQGIATVITDVAGRRDVCHMRLTSDVVLIRFVGNGLHPSDYTRIQAWAERLAVWYKQGLKAAYFFTHEPDNLLAPDLAAYCAEAFGARMPEVEMRGPREVVPPAVQGSLF